VQRWHDAEHDSSTQAGLTQSGQGATLAQIFGGPTGANDGRYDTAPKVAARLGDASVNMDRFTPQVTAGPERESHNVGRLGTLAMFGGSIVTSTMGRGLSQLAQMVSGPPQTPYAVGDPLPARGILGEGANHAEFGDYKLALNASSAGNTQAETRFIDASIDALDARPLTPDKVDVALNRLGDAAHISADRGSHGEGARGAGHDTPYPPPGREGQTLMPYYMEGWEDNDDPALNPNGYTYGVNATASLFGRFVAAAAARNWPRPPPQIPPRQNRAPLQNRPPVPTSIPGDTRPGAWRRWANRAEPAAGAGGVAAARRSRPHSGQRKRNAPPGSITRRTGRLESVG
jgi:hypothetical protein